MKHKISCEMIRDLLPGYLDEILSKSSIDAVEEHLAECENCEQIYQDMKAELETETISQEQMALDGFKKVRQHMKLLKVVFGITVSFLICCVAVIFIKVFVIGEPVSTSQINITETHYDEETDCLTVSGEIGWFSYHISRVEWSEESKGTVNIVVHAAESLPFQQEKEIFTITIPNIRGKRVYLACPDYDKREIYAWKYEHYKELDALEDEIYQHFKDLDREKDVLVYNSWGMDTVNGVEGIYFSVEHIVGEDATFWWFNDQLCTDGDLESKGFDIWISWEKPYQILKYNYQTGEYTEE